jgi:hypothetical protein
MRLRVFIAVLVGAIAGGAAYALMLPWGEPCTFQPDAGHGCTILFTEAQQTLRNVAFFIVAVGAGWVGALIARRDQYLAGIASAICAPACGYVISRVAYAMPAPPAWDLSLPGTVTSLLAAGVGLGVCGAVGALLSRYIALTRAGAGREA